MSENVQIKRKIGLSVFDLKCIAVFTMLIDHIGAFLYPQAIWMRYVGRLAFPIYCFLIAEGYIHTRDVKKYMGRLFLFALLSEIPYDLARNGMVFYKDHQNVFFTLLLGLICIYALDTLHSLWKSAAVFAAVGLLTHFIVRPDYGIGGIVMILLFYVFRGRTLEKWVSVGALNIAYYGGIQSAAVLALIPIQLYNGSKGRSAKYFFYAFYPVHLAAIYFIRRYMIYVV